jgi:uncharacterized protein
MDTGWDDQGTTYIRRNSGREGEYVDLLAMMDVLAVPILCGSGDVQPTASFFPKPIEIRIFQASTKTIEAVEDDNARMRLKNHRTVDDFVIKEILATRELTADPDYKPTFVNYPLQFASVQVELSELEYEQLQRLRFADYQDDEEIIREAVMRWMFRNRTRRGKLKRSAASK